MTFLNPLLLAGAALVALPIVLHLIMRRKPRHLEFPALRFLEAKRETNQRRLAEENFTQALAIAVDLLPECRHCRYLTGTWAGVGRASQQH